MPYEKNFCLHLPEELTINKTLKENPSRSFLPVMKPFETLALQSDFAHMLLQEYVSPHFHFLFLQSDVRAAMEIPTVCGTSGFLYLMGIRGDNRWLVDGHAKPIHCQRGRQCGLSAPAGNHILTLGPGVHQFLLVYTCSFLFKLIAGEWPEFNQSNRSGNDLLLSAECLPSTIYPQASYNAIGRLTASKEKNWSLHRVLENTIFTLIKNYAKQLNVLKEHAENGKPDIRARAMQYIRLHYTDPELSKASVAEAMHVSNRTLDYAFKPGFTKVYNYILKIRLLKAGELLRLTDRPVQAIMFEVGFDDRSNFRKAFRKYFGMSPSEYRHQAKK